MINSSPSPSDNKGEQADRVPQPGPEREDEKKPIPETGWEGETPSHKGGDYEEDFLNKPPYRWSSDKFVKKYERWVRAGRAGREVDCYRVRSRSALNGEPPASPPCTGTGEQACDSRRGGGPWEDGRASR